VFGCGVKKGGKEYVGGNVNVAEEDDGGNVDAAINSVIMAFKCYLICVVQDLGKDDGGTG
jgi:hypothetical protein